MSAEQLITQHIITWTSALQTRSTAGRGNNGKIDLYGIKKLREMILELAVRGKLVPQDPNDEPASELLKRIATEKAELVKQGKIKKQKPLTEISEDEKPFELPVGWEWVRISEIGHDWGQKTPDLQFTYIDVGSINKKLGIISEPEIVQAENAPSRARKIVKEGTVVYSTVRPYLLNIAIVSEKFDPEPIASTAFAIIHPFKGILSNYIYYYLRSSTFITYVEGCQTGIAYPAINDKQFFSGLIAIPPSNEQDLIVNKVGELMALCDQLEQQSLTSLEAHSQLVETLLATLTNSQNAEELAENWARISQHFDTLFTTEASIDALKQTILQLAVMGKLVPQDPNDEPASELLKRIEQEKAQLVKEGKIKKGKAFTKMADKNKHTLPNGWIKCHLGDVIAISSGDGLTLKQMDSDGKIPVYGGNGITGYHNDWNIQKPTIVIGRVGYYCGSIHITPSLAWVTDNAFRTFHSTSNIDIKFLSILLKGTNLKENENATAQPVISANKIYPISIMLPPLNEQKRIFKKFNELISFCEALKSSLQSAQQTQLHLADALTDAALS
ncbi:restriction endonuclease subunit S [Pantoea sp. SIMBA_079]|uniref:restriction endonuclease subunit S n=1 Tax=Pantoea sp. SIMBA_079 TaxID=3085817 RepID=UPI0039964B22